MWIVDSVLPETCFVCERLPQGSSLHRTSHVESRNSFHIARQVVLKGAGIFKSRASLRARITSPLVNCRLLPGSVTNSPRGDCAKTGNRRYAVSGNRKTVATRPGASRQNNPTSESKNMLHGVSISDPTNGRKATITGRQLKGKSSFFSAVRLVFPLARVTAFVSLAKVGNVELGVMVQGLKALVSE